MWNLVHSLTGWVIHVEGIQQIKYGREWTMSYTGHWGTQSDKKANTWQTYCSFIANSNNFMVLNKVGLFVQGHSWLLDHVVCGVMSTTYTFFYRLALNKLTQESWKVNRNQLISRLLSKLYCQWSFQKLLGHGSEQCWKTFSQQFTVGWHWTHSFVNTFLTSYKGISCTIGVNNISVVDCYHWKLCHFTICYEK